MGMELSTHSPASSVTSYPSPSSTSILLPVVDFRDLPFHLCCVEVSE